MDGTSPNPDWTLKESAALYRIEGWGAPYFRINEGGHVEVRPDPRQDRAIDLHELTEQLTARGIELPVLLRFPNILADRIRRLNECFRRAIDEYGYRGDYRGVYPVKVNQQRHLVEQVVKLGRPWRFGLEAGSKPELLVAIAVTHHDDGFIICNGYKDLAYMETALVAQRFDNTVIIVLERIEELELALRASEELGIRPLLGVRAKLSSKGTGLWAASVGERAKFGLTSAEIVSVVDELREREMLDCLQLLHFHMGSQVSSIVPIKNAMRESAHIYVELAKLGAKMRYLDVGGGLAVDYDGSRSGFHASRNYQLQEYAYDVVHAIQDACDRAEIEHPTIVTETGRAMAAYQSVFLFDVLGVDQVHFEDPTPPAEHSHAVLKELYDTWNEVRPKSVQEAFHDAVQGKEEAQSLFKFGYLGLRELAEAERLYWSCCVRILKCMESLRKIPDELHNLRNTLGAIYYCNMSIFQSAPDIWALDHLFPIMPIHRLDEEPTMQARLADLTCDSDGMVHNFIGSDDVKPTLEVHAPRSGEPYVLGLFLGGAYQEILGDLHNLFGDTNAVHVLLEGDRYRIAQVIRGESIDQVLRHVDYDPADMIEDVRHQAEHAVGEGRMTVSQMRLFMKHYEDSLRGYTYLKSASS